MANQGMDQVTGLTQAGISGPEVSATAYLDQQGDVMDVSLSELPFAEDQALAKEEYTGGSILLDERGSMSRSAAKMVIGLTGAGALGIGIAGVAGNVVPAERDLRTIELDIDTGYWSTQLTATDGLLPNGEESSWYIAGHGSCSPYTRQDAYDAMEAIDGKTPDELAANPVIDLVDAEVQFLEDNPDFATNFALTSESRMAVLYDVLNVAKPSENPDTANQSIIELFENEYYVTARLASPLAVENTYCDSQGRLHHYRDVSLEAGTMVGGVMIDSLETVNGKLHAVFANGEARDLNPNETVADVVTYDAEGKEVIRKMLAKNKAGVNIDGDEAAEIACMNVLGIPPETFTPETVPSSTTSTTEATTTSTSTTSTTTVTSSSTTSTSQPTTSTTRRRRHHHTTTTTPPPPPPPPGGPPPKEPKPTPDTRPTSSTTFTTSPGEVVDPHEPDHGPTTSTTAAEATTSTTEGAPATTAKPTTTTAAPTTSTTSPSTTMAPPVG